MKSEELLKKANSIAFKVLLAIGVGLIAAQSIYSVSAVNFIFNRDIYSEWFYIFGGLFYFATIYRGIIGLAEDAKKLISTIKA